MLDDDRLPATVVQLLQAEDRLRIVVERMASEELHAAAGQIRIDLRRDQDGHIVLPGDLQEHLGLLHELVPRLRLIVPQTIEHRQRIDDDQGDGLVLRQLPDLLDAVGLLLQTVYLEDEEIPHSILVLREDLHEPLRRKALVIYVRDPRPVLRHLARGLQADVRLARARLPVEERDASGLDPASQKTVELGTGKGYAHLRLQ